MKSVGYLILHVIDRKQAQVGCDFVHKNPKHVKKLKLDILSLVFYFLNKFIQHLIGKPH